MVQILQNDVLLSHHNTQLIKIYPDQCDLRICYLKLERPVPALNSTLVYLLANGPENVRQSLWRKKFGREGKD